MYKLYYKIQKNMRNKILNYILCTLYITLLVMFLLFVMGVEYFAEHLNILGFYLLVFTAIAIVAGRFSPYRGRFIFKYLNHKIWKILG